MYDMNHCLLTSKIKTAKQQAMTLGFLLSQNRTQSVLIEAVGAHLVDHAAKADLIGMSKTTLSHFKQRLILKGSKPWRVSCQDKKLDKPDKLP